MDTGSTLESSVQQAAQYIRDADGLLITAGAGMGVDSGLSDFRGTEGFWNAYPALGKLNIQFQDIANPTAFEEDPALAWGFYGHRLNLYRKTVPHDGFRILQEIAAKMPNGAFVATSNVDGQFQKAGFSEQHIYEIHGSIHRLQCMGHCHTWSAAEFMPEVDEERCHLISELPHCPTCGRLARPNILMFSDWDWSEGYAEVQQMRFRGWLGGVKKLVVIEIGAGKNIPTIRNLSERQEGKVIRINPKDYWLHPGKGVSLSMNGLDALKLIEVEMKNVSTLIS